MTPGKNGKRGSGRTPGEINDGEERLSFGRGLASSGRPRNLCVRRSSWPCDSIDGLSPTEPGGETAECWAAA